MSPAKRATRPLGGKTLAMRAPSERRTASPTLWPMHSLIRRKWSTSKKTTDNGARSAPAASMCATRMSRLASPVRGSRQGQVAQGLFAGHLLGDVGPAQEHPWRPRHVNEVGGDGGEDPPMPSAVLTRYSKDRPEHRPAAAPQSRLTVATHRRRTPGRLSRGRRETQEAVPAAGWRQGWRTGCARRARRGEEATGSGQPQPAVPRRRPVRLPARSLETRPRPKDRPRPGPLL